MSMRPHPSTILLACCGAFLGGVWLATLYPALSSAGFLLTAACAATALLTVWWGNRTALLVVLGIVSAACGLYRNQPALIPDSIALGKSVWVGTVAQEPDARDEHVMLAVSIESNPDAFLVQVTVPRYPEFFYGDRLRLDGALVPVLPEEDSYAKYLSARGYLFTIRYPTVELLERGKGNPAFAAIYAFKARFLDRLSQMIPEPQNSLLAGILVGARRAIPDDVQDDFRAAGLSHIVAISGYNISIITRLMADFFRRRFGRTIALAVSLLGVAGFVVMTGAQASVVRAAAMGMVAVLGSVVGRPSRAYALLLLAAAAMVAYNPRLLVYDLGFQLSFAATLGLIMLADTFFERFVFLPKFLGLRETLAATLAAQLFVLPMLWRAFGEISLIAPLANLLILPVIPWIMASGFLAGLLALAWAPLGYLPAWATWALLAYALSASAWCASLPAASIAVPDIPLWAAGLYYALLFGIGVAALVRRREKRLIEFRNFTTT